MESGQPWVWGVTRPTKGEAGGEWMTDSGTDPQSLRIRAVVNRPAEKPIPAFEPATSASLSQKHTTTPRSPLHLLKLKSPRGDLIAKFTL